MLSLRCENKPRQTLLSHTKYSSTYKLTKIQQLPNTSIYKPKTCKLTNPRPHRLINPQPHNLTNPTISSTQKFKLLSFILQSHTNFRSVLAKIKAIIWVKWHFFWSFTPSNLSVLKKTTCILYHLAFLVCLQPRIFSTPKYPLLASKTPLFNRCFALLNPFFMARKGSVYNIAVDIYAFLPCI